MKSPTILFITLFVLLNGLSFAQEKAKGQVKVPKDTVHTAKRDSVKVLKQVDIKFKKQAIERKGDRLIFNVEGNSTAAGSPLLDVMRLVPGLSVTNDKLNIRGKEGLIIMIDNRRTYMSGDELLSYLKNTPAETILQLEVITNPSARYDAEGNAGIINIKTKKGGLNGVTATLSQTLGYGKFLKSTSGGQITYIHDNLSLFGNSYLSNNKTFENYYSETSGANIDKISTNNYIESKNRSSYSYQLGFEYRFNPHSSIGGVTDGSLNPNYQSAGLSMLKKTGTDPQYITTSEHSNTNNKNGSNNLHYNWNSDKNTDVFSADANYVKYDFNLGSGQFSNYFDDQYYGNITGNEQLRNRSIRTVNVIAGKADYSHKWNEKHDMESGIKWSSVTTSSDLVYEQLENTNWTNDPGKTNQYKFKEQIYAGYINYNGQFGSLHLQAGLRAEQTVNDGYSKTVKSEAKRNYLKLFPSIFLNQTLMEDHSWSLSYSYRIDRPTYSYLNPFTFINNPYSYFRGNSYLKPQYTHNFEGNYDYKKKIFLTIGYSHTMDMITIISEREALSEVIGGTRINLNSMNSYNLSINTPLKPLKGWDINIYASAYRNIVIDGEGFKNGKTTFTTTINSSVSLPAGIIMDINGDYQTAMSYGTIVIKPMYAVNGGLKKAFLDSKLNLRLNVSDIFNQRKMAFNSDYAGIINYGLNRSESRIARLTASYKFGKIKGQKQRGTGVDEEQKRAGN